LIQTSDDFQVLFDFAAVAIALVDKDGVIRQVNQAFLRLTGHTRQSIQHSSFLLLTPLQDQSSEWKVHQELIHNQRKIYTGKKRFLRPNGQWVWRHLTATLIEDAQGSPLLVCWTVEDPAVHRGIFLNPESFASHAHPAFHPIITHLLHHTETELNRWNTLLQGLAEATQVLLTHLDLEAGIQEALETFGQAASIDRLYIFEFFAAGEKGFPRYEWVQPGISFHPKEQDYTIPSRWHKTLASGCPVSGLTRFFPENEQSLLLSHQVFSTLIVPIVVKGHLWGSLGVDDCSQERSWASGEESIVRVLSSSIGGVIERQHSAKTMLYQAHHDPLTGLLNRLSFDSQLAMALKQALHSSLMLAVLFLDLDRFKTINDGLGHTAGDHLLQTVARRLKTTLQQGEIIARWGGDEFTLLLIDIQSGEDVAKRARAILDTLKPPIQLENQEIYITGSIGIALYPQDGLDAETLIKHADSALYRAKERGRNDYHFFSSLITSNAGERLALESSLYRALEEEEFVVYYQPLIDPTTGRIVRMEALVRWQHPELGLLSPQHFIPLAEENGLVVPIGEWVMQVACRQAALWHADQFSSLVIAVNLSARQFQQTSLPKQIQSILRDCGLDPKYLDLEITESLAMQNINFTIQQLHEIRAMGVEISLDDFGTGYCSLNYLKHFPINSLKIDHSFITNLVKGSQDRAIVETIILLGRGLNLKVIAEGVETAQQFEILRRMGCNEIQGFLFSRPLPVETASALLLHNRKLETAEED
jgi:diguanylate cyclase (GGDEF)-like protein/PAS domain S-box-containing protein